MKGRWVLLGAVIGFVAALTLGAGLSGGAGPGDRAARSGRTGGMMADRAAMHDSPAMQEMHARMPDDLREQCEEIHARMGDGHDGMMGEGHDGMMGEGHDGMMGEGS